ncbi:MAG: sulfite exporter TauE/SafE family protein [Dermatophilaceae bacterium]
MSLAEALLVVAAGVGAGTINTVVGSGTLITFPALLLLGVSPVTANISNTIGLVPGSVTGALGYRSELVGARGDLIRLAPMSFVGGVAGAVLLLVLDPAIFAAIVPVLIAVGVVLVVAGPRVSAWAAQRREQQQRPVRDAGRRGAMQVGALVVGVYGGYFGAAQGVILVGVLGMVSTAPLQRLTAYKNVLAAVVNAVAAAVFVAAAWELVDWGAAALIAVGSAVGGVVGSTLGRRLSPPMLRAIVVIVGVVAVGAEVTRG